MLQVDWEETPTGFRARGADAERFEVICAGCGDLDGPPDYQPREAQLLRGPYVSERDARRIAHAHERATRLGATGQERAGTLERWREAFPESRLRRLIELRRDAGRQRNDQNRFAR